MTQTLGDLINLEDEKLKGVLKSDADLRRKQRAGKPKN